MKTQTLITVTIATTTTLTPNSLAYTVSQVGLFKKKCIDFILISEVD